MSGGATWWSTNYFIDGRFGDKEAKMETEDNTVNHENDVEKTEDACPVAIPGGIFHVQREKRRQRPDAVQTLFDLYSHFSLQDFSV